MCVMEEINKTRTNKRGSFCYRSDNDYFSVAAHSTWKSYQIHTTATMLLLFTITTFHLVKKMATYADFFFHLWLGLK